MKCVLWLVVLISVAQCSPMSQNELEDFSNFLLKTSSLDIHVKSADPDASLDEDEVVSDHAWEDSGKFEGDLILNDRQRRLIVENVEGLSRNGLTDSTKRWPNNEVIYFIQIEHFNSGQVQAIQAGIDDLAQASCVKFRPYRKGDRDAVVIQGSRRGCFSQVGYQGGYQVLNLSGRHPVGRGCFRHGTVVHELLHSLGFFHMQSSPDRDDYVDVKWANILQPARHNFRKYNMFSVSDFGVGYDYDSVLHYSRRAFSVNGQDTLVPKKDGAEIGQRVGLSDKDTQKLNKMYCDADYDSAVQADENTTKKPKKKKKPKNKPFEGQGIGYHQGKTVVIKLPAAEIFKIPNVPSTHVFDFSKTPQVMSEAEGYRFGEEITYSYKPISSPDFDITRNYDEPEVKSDRSKHLKLFDATEEAKPSKEINDKKSFPNQANEVKLENVPNDDLDKDLKDAFDRLSKIVKQHINRKNKDYDSKIIKDYSQYAKPSEHQHSESHEKFEQPTSYESSTLTPVSHIDVARSLDYNVQNNQIKDRMDSSFGTSLPTKNSYSVYEQSETPNYATLDYLKIRHDFSDIYSPKPPESKQKVDGISAHVEEPIRHKEHIKIAPYDQGFFTDYLDKNDRLVDPTQIFLKQKVVSSKYEQKEMPKQLQLEKGIDFSHIILLPTKKPYSAHEQTETPIYATLGYLKDRHDISNIYPPNKSEDKTKNEPVTKDDEPPTEDDWHIKDSYKYNPADYDRNSYVDFIRLKDKDKYGSSEEEESAKESLSKAKLKNVPDGYTRETSYKDNGKLTAKNKLNGDKNIQNQSSDDERDDYDYYNKKDDHSSPNENSQPKKEPPYDQHKSDYNNDFEKEYDTYSKESHEVSSTKSPKQNEAYTLYGVPVPLTKDWYKITYSIPDKSKIGEKSS